MRALRARGMLVVGLSRRPSTADEHEECDVAERASVDAAAARVLERHPRIDLLVNNAGVGARGNYLDAGPEMIERVVQVNYLGSVWSTLAFLPGLGKGSHIVNLVSVAGTVAVGPYAASKHAQLAFSRSLSSALSGSRISVHAVLPGFVETEGFPQRNVLKSALLRRFVIEPDDVAAAILKAIEKGKAETVVPWFPYRVTGIAQAVAPGLVARFAGISAQKGEA